MKFTAPKDRKTYYSTKYGSLAGTAAKRLAKNQWLLFRGKGKIDADVDNLQNLPNCLSGS